jgi:hypothetical protein
MKRKVNLKILNEWTKGKLNPHKELEFRANIAAGTVRKVFRGELPGRKVRISISSATGIDEDILFPTEGESLAA